MTVSLFVPLLALALAAVPAAFDKVLLTDGRLIEGKLLQPTDDATTPLEIRGIVIPVPNAKIDKTFVEDLEDYVPKNKKEEDYLKKGWVLFEGKWMSRTRREQELAERREAAEKAIAETQRMADWKNAQVVTTPVFKITSNASQDVLDMYVEYLETYYRYFKDVWSISLTPELKKDKIPINIYRTAGDYYKYGGGRPGTLGYFRPSTMELHLFYDIHDVDGSVNTLFHEANHLITFLIDTGFLYPRWINESVAEYYGSAQIDEKGNFTVGHLQYGRIAHMQATEKVGKGLTPKQVLLTDHAGFTALHYAVGWSFVHFLMESPQYGDKFRTFFGTLPQNRDIAKTNEPWLQGSTIKMARESDVLDALLKKLGKTIDELDDEWRIWVAQAYGEMPANAYVDAASLALRFPEDDGSHVERAMEFFDKATSKGTTNPWAYYRYARMLRLGGVENYNEIIKPHDPEPARALEMIDRAIELDPLQALFYAERGEILLMEGELRDIDAVADMAITARAIDPDNSLVRAAYNSLVAMVRENRERIAAEEEAAAAAAAAAVAYANRPGWIILPHYIDGEPEPERIPDLSVEDVRRMIHEGEIDGLDWAFNTLPALDPISGEELPLKPWESERLQLKDIPLFAEDLEQVGWTEPPPPRGRR